MSHTIFGFLALLATLAVLLSTWEAPRWAIRAFCVCAAFGAMAVALSRPGPVGPADERPQPRLSAGADPAFEGTWDARGARRPGAAR